MALDIYRYHEGIYFPIENVEAVVSSRFKRAWDANAASDHVTAAIGLYEGKREDYATLTSRVKIFAKLPTQRHFGSILEIGCGYGRVPLYLSTEKGWSCDRYYGIDVSEEMLRQFLRYRSLYNIFPRASLFLINQSAETLPLDDDSVNLVLSSAVFIHLPKPTLRKVLSEAGRVLKPGGKFLFEDSFANRSCVANIPSYLWTLVPAGLQPYYRRYYSLGEVKALLRQSGIAEKASGYRIEPAGYGLVPGHVNRFRVPFARAINRRVNTAAVPNWLRGPLATFYRAYSDKI